MLKLARAQDQIRALAMPERIGAIILAEQAVDDHAALFLRPSDRATALDALTQDLHRMGILEPALLPFLRKVEEYIALIQDPRSTEEPVESMALV